MILIQYYLKPISCDRRTITHLVKWFSKHYFSFPKGLDIENSKNGNFHNHERELIVQTSSVSGSLQCH